jgi:cytochrome b6-f complex iron-sulfur subunit
MSCEDCLSRRKFLASAVGAAGVIGLVTLTGCGDGQLSGVQANTGGGGGGGGGPGGGIGPVTIKVGDYAGLANNGVLVAVNSFTAVVRTGPASFDAFSMYCTHQGCLTDIFSGSRFVCPCHGSEFSNTGAVTQGPAARPLDKYTTAYNSTTDQLTIS